MKQQDFIDALYAAGWDNIGDAQHTNIRYLHKQMFPIIAELEETIIDLESEIDQANI